MILRVAGSTDADTEKAASSQVFRRVDVTQVDHGGRLHDAFQAVEVERPEGVPFRDDYDHVGPRGATRPSAPHRGAPETFDTDQGSQSTSPHLVEVVQAVGTRMVMCMRARWMGYVFNERLWHSLEYECIYCTPSRPAQGCELGSRCVGYYHPYRPH